MTEYNCIFDHSLKCPVRTEYKLQPESLVDFCALCGNRSTKNKRDIELLNAVAPIITTIMHDTATERLTYIEYNRQLVNEILKLKK